ncbi:MAG: hypothetical protein Q9175_003065 [Cornicularia normoerica]
MTSEFARNQGLSQRTREAYERSRGSNNVEDRLHFYLTYLEDLVPFGLTVHHVPTQRGDDPRPSNAREEIQLLTFPGMIFMSGLVSMESAASLIETVAASEAYTKWLDGDFVPDYDNWRFFTGLATIRFFKSHDGDEWELEREFHPILHAAEMADTLDQEFDKLENYQ